MQRKILLTRVSGATGVYDVVYVALVQTHDHRQIRGDVVQRLVHLAQHFVVVVEHSVVKRSQQVRMIGHDLVAQFIPYYFSLIGFRVLADDFLAQFAQVVHPLLREQIARRVYQPILSMEQHVDSQQGLHVVDYKLVAQTREQLGHYLLTHFFRQLHEACTRQHDVRRLGVAQFVDELIQRLFASALQIARHLSGCQVRRMRRRIRLFSTKVKSRPEELAGR